MMEQPMENKSFTVNDVTAIHHEYIKVDITRQVLNDDGRRILELINFVVICSLTSLLGIVANIINIIIFYKQGFHNTANIAFFGLAISDLCCLTTLKCVSIGMNPLLENSSIAWEPTEVIFLVGAWPHVCFCRITSYITAYITAERYLCAAIPLKVKQIVTTKVTTITICGIYVVNLLTLIPDYASTYLGWKFSTRKNITLLGLTFTESRKQVEGLQNVLHSLLGMLSFAAVIVFTVALVGKLNQAAEWRRITTSSSKQAGSLSTKDQKIMKMVVSIATVLIVCYSPGAMISFTTFIIGPEFNIQGKYLNICMALWSFAYSFQSVNSSINILFYYTMSSKFKSMFREVFLKSPPQG